MDASAAPTPADATVETAPPTDHHETSQATAATGTSASGTDTPLVLLSLSKIADQLSFDFGDKAPSHITLKRWSSAGELVTARHPDPSSPDRRSLYDLAAMRAIVMDRMASRFAEPPPPSDHDLAAAQLAPPTAELRQLDARLSDIAAQVATIAPALANMAVLADSARTQAARQVSAPAAPAADIAALLNAMQQLRTAVTEQTAALNSAVTRIDRRLDAIESANKSAAELTRAAGDLEHTRKSLMARYDGELTTLRQRLQATDAAGAGRSNAAVEHVVAQLQRAVSRLEQLGPHGLDDAPATVPQATPAQRQALDTHETMVPRG